MFHFQHLVLQIGILLFMLGSSVAKVVTTSKTGDDNAGGFLANSSVLSTLASKLFVNYDAGVRPYCSDATSTTLYVDMAIRQLIEMDEPNQIIRINLWMRLKWTDCLLGWNPADFDNITVIKVPYGRAWVPDISIYERVSEEFFGLKDFPMHIFHDGTVRYNFPSTIEALCPIDVKMFPYDTQVCPLTFASWAYTGQELNLSSQAMQADLSTLKINVEWVVPKVPAVRQELQYASGSFPEVIFYVFISRKPLHYLNNIILPSLAISCVAILGFILPVDSGEKVGLELTVMLALSVFQLLVADSLPPSSESTPWIVTYFNFSLILCGIASLFQVFVLNLHYRGDEKMSMWVANYILQPLSSITLTKIPGYKYCGCLRDRDNYTVKPPTEEQLWMILAKCVDRFGLIFFVFAFSIGTILFFAMVIG